MEWRGRGEGASLIFGLSRSHTKHGRRTELRMGGGGGEMEPWRKSGRKVINLACSLHQHWKPLPPGCLSQAISFVNTPFLPRKGIYIKRPPESLPGTAGKSVLSNERLRGKCLEECEQESNMFRDRPKEKSKYLGCTRKSRKILAKRAQPTSHRPFQSISKFVFNLLSLVNPQAFAA